MISPGSKFRFHLDFEGLSDVEAGALLWLLRLGSEERYLRIGNAKPHGFGSVRVRANYEHILDHTAVVRRYRDVAEPEAQTGDALIVGAEHGSLHPRQPSESCCAEVGFTFSFAQGSMVDSYRSMVGALIRGLIPSAAQEPGHEAIRQALQ